MLLNMAGAFQRIGAMQATWINLSNRDSKKVPISLDVWVVQSLFKDSYQDKRRSYESQRVKGQKVYGT